MNQIPFDSEAEMSVLGTVFIDPARYGDVARILKPGDFYMDKNQELFTIFGLCVSESHLDLITVKAKATERNTLDYIGGLEYIVEIANLVPDVSAVMSYAEIIKDCAIRRRMISGFAEAERRLFDRGDKIQHITDFVQTKIMAETAKGETVKSIGDSVYDFLDELERRNDNGDKMAGISTGYDEIDAMTGGLEKGKLYIIGGRPAMGKSAFALNIAANIAKNNDTVMYFSLEMQNYEVLKRIMSSESRISAKKIKMAVDLKDEDFGRMGDAGGKFVPESMFIDDSSYQTMQTITAACIAMNNRLLKYDRKLSCIFIDHLHLLSSGMKGADRRLQIGESSRLAKILANKMDCPVVLLSQLSRAGRSRSDNKPILSDLRESGDIEQDADVVMFVHREEYYDEKAEHGKAEIIFAKNRDGECGTVTMGWNSYITTFEPWEAYSAAESRKSLPPIKKNGGDR